MAAKTRSEKDAHRPDFCGECHLKISECELNSPFGNAEKRAADHAELTSLYVTNQPPRAQKTSVSKPLNIIFSSIKVQEDIYPT